jgi:hypothetical protein
MNDVGEQVKQPLLYQLLRLDQGSHTCLSDATMAARTRCQCAISMSNAGFSSPFPVTLTLVAVHCLPHVAPRLLVQAGSG